MEYLVTMTDYFQPLEEQHLVWLVNYIHRNPETHGFVKDFRNYSQSSYKSFLTGSPTKLKRIEVLDWFGGKEAFIRFHETNPVYKDQDDFVID